MLGRIGSGSAVAALFIGVLAIAVGAESCIAAWLSGAGAVGVMLITFAPWIPGVRRLLPSHHRLVQLERFWVEGDTLRTEPVADDEQLEAWLARRHDWHQRTAHWIAENISLVDARRFSNPPVVAYSISGVYNAIDNEARNRIGHQLPELIRLRDAERPK